jgi:hypothetical protein
MAEAVEGSARAAARLKAERGRVITGPPLMVEKSMKCL